MADLISIDEARRRVLAEVRPLAAEAVPLEQALGRVLAAEVTSRVDVPPFDTSAMDGFAVASVEAARLEVVGESRAGHPCPVAVQEGTAVAISTGAAIPEGTAAVVPVERTTASGAFVQVEAVAENANVRRAGEDVRAGTPVMRAGTDLDPAALGVLAGVGTAAPPCSRKPRVAVSATGDELVEPGGQLGPGLIWSSNSIALAGQATGAGGQVVSTETVPDDPCATREAIERALGLADVVCVSGGVSVGAHDHVKGALAELGVHERFWGVALQPGKPTWFGVAERPGGRVLVFGLPGNPVSAMVTFHLFARPALRAMQGTEPRPRAASAVLDQPLRRNARRDQAVRCSLSAEHDGWHAVPTGPQGSHVMTSMLGADALAIVPAGEGELPAGERVRLELLDRWSRESTV
ncbi:MAG TPA: gephyrin-like molybdotransferase Glp [Thermoleophilaceae bacterium]|nr:gephyrin-like molybdotransferase Glp [Thermoleophilaceae bacterium]